MITDVLFIDVGPLGRLDPLKRHVTEPLPAQIHFELAWLASVESVHADVVIDIHSAEAEALPISSNFSDVVHHERVLDEFIKWIIVFRKLRRVWLKVFTGSGWQIRPASGDGQLAVFHALHSDQFIGNMLDRLHFAPDYEHLKTVVRIKMHVER